MQTDTPSVVVRRCQCVCLRLGILTAFGWVGYVVEMSSVGRLLPRYRLRAGAIWAAPFEHSRHRDSSIPGGEYQALNARYRQQRCAACRCGWCNRVYGRFQPPWHCTRH